MSVRRHLGFGSTPNFPNLHKQVEHLTDNAGRLAFANYDPTIGKPPTEVQQELLASYKCTMPIVTFIGSEKLHGENMAVCCSGEEVWVQGRNHIRTILGDQNGMAAFVESTKAQWLTLFKQLIEMYDINTYEQTIVIDCEWAGGNIQKGNAACSGTPKGAYIFDYFRVVNNTTDESQYKPTTGLKVFSEDSIYLMQNFNRYEAVLDFNKPQECEQQLKDLAIRIEKNSTIAEWFDKPDNVGEGAYLWAEYNGTMLRLKTKGELHGGKPKQPRTPKVTASPKEVKRQEELAAKVTPVWRITQAITETNATERKHLGEVIKWVIADVAKEESPTLAEAGILLKDLSRYISAEVKRYYFDSIKGY